MPVTGKNTNGHLVICQAAAVSFGVWFSLRKLIWLDSDNTHPPWIIELPPLTIQSASQNNEPSALSILGANMAGTFSQPAEYRVYDGSDSATGLNEPQSASVWKEVFFLIVSIILF